MMIRDTETGKFRKSSEKFWVFVFVLDRSSDSKFVTVTVLCLISVHPNFP